MSAQGARTLRSDERAPQAPGTGARGPARGQRLAAAGSLLGALAASSCCILPLVLFSLGASGAWLGQLSGLAPYQPAFVGVTLGLLGYGYYLVYRRPKGACTRGASCARPRASRTAVVSLWTATALLAAAVAFPYVAPALLDL